MLICLILVPIIASALIGFMRLPGRPLAIASALISALLTIVVLTGSPQPDTSSLQLTLDLPLSRIMLVLTALVTLAAAIGLRAPDAQASRSWSISMLLISAGATGAFMSDNMISFFAFHELALIPTFIMIGCYGRGDRRTISWTATIYLGLASMVLLAGIILLTYALNLPDFNFSSIAPAVAAGTISVTENAGLLSIAGLLLLIGFGTLVSLFPFHSWAGPAYASAPTPVAMMHAGVLKKFGLYGLFTIASALGGMNAYIFQPWLPYLLFCLLGNVLWVGYVTVNKGRLDDMLGNSSVMHMGYLFLGFAAYIAYAPQHLELAFNGAALLMLGHGLTIGLLFLLTGQIEAQTRTLELDSMGGLGTKLPKLGFLFGLAGMASIGLPLLANFPGEFAIFMSCFQDAALGCSEGGACPFSWVGVLFGGVGPVQVAAILAMWGLVIGAVYMLRAFRRVFKGEVAMASERATSLSCYDIVAAAILAAALVFFGIFPQIGISLLG